MSERPTSLIRRDLPPWGFAACVMAVVALQVALILTHDYFVDEWQALLIAVQSPDLEALLGNLRYEGHPPLWYLFLRGLSAIFGPGSAMRAASLLCALATIAIVATRAPLPRWARLAVLFAEPILFEYGTISRGFTLGITLTFAILALWERRRAAWPLIALLPLVDFLFGVVALALIALRWSERRPLWWPGVGAFGLASAVAAWSVVPAADFISVYRPSAPLQSLAHWMAGMATVTLPVQWRGGPRWDVAWDTPAMPLLGIGYFLIAYIQTRGRPVERAVAIGFPLVLLGFMVAVHMFAIRHLLLVAVVFLIVLWRQGAASVPMRMPSAAWLAASALCGLATAGFALTRPFDTAPQAARAIEALGLERESWLSFPMQHAQGVSVLTSIPFEAVERGCRPEYVRWNYRHRLTDPVRLRDWLAREAGRGGSFYLLSQYAPATGGPVRHIATVPPGLDGKVYRIYRVKGDKPGLRAPAPPCVPGNRPLPPFGR